MGSVQNTKFYIEGSEEREIKRECRLMSSSQCKRQRLCVHAVDLGIVMCVIRSNAVPFFFPDRYVFKCSHDACRNPPDSDGSLYVSHRVCMSERGVDRCMSPVCMLIDIRGEEHKSMSYFQHFIRLWIAFVSSTRAYKCLLELRR